MIETDWQGRHYELADVDASALLELLPGSVLQQREADRRKFHLALRWLELHPAAGDDRADLSLIDRSVDDAVPIGGEGSPEVRGSAVAPFAAALGVTTASGAHLLADAADLFHRLPRTWSRYCSLDVDTWKVRLLARLTRCLSLEAAAWVDAALADRIAGRGAPTIERAVASAIAMFHPELLAERNRRGKAAWQVTVKHPGVTEADGTSAIDGYADSADLADFDRLLSRLANRLAAEGDDDTHDQRCAKALGLIAREFDERDDSDGHGRSGAPDRIHDGRGFDESDDPPGPRRGRGTRRGGRRVTHLYIHGSLADFAAADRLTTSPGAATGSAAAPGAVEAERLGVVAADVARRWLAESDSIRVTAVVDLNRLQGAVDEHDPPPWMREMVILRDRHCIFPWCETDARSCDLDHVIPYRPNGPPGQTNPDNLAPVCRRHHNLKTFGGWHYQRTRDGTYVWHDPYFNVYAVDGNGTQHVRWTA